MKTGQSERLFDLIQTALTQAGLARTDLSLICVGIGPGNFTGTRIGVAAARGLALSLGIRAIGISRLEALLHGQSNTPAAVTAHRGHAFLQYPAQDPELVETASLPTQLCVDESFPDPGTAMVVPLAELLPTMASLAQAQPDVPAPAPLYLRAPDAALPSEQPPVILP